MKGRKWRFDFGYPNGTGIQRSALLSAAAILDLTPVYALYLGTGDYREWEPCPDGHRGKRCTSCRKRSISLMPALLADQAIIDSSNTYERSVALEDVCTPTTTWPPFIPSLMKQGLAPALQDFLMTPQMGAREVAKKMIDRVLKVRAWQFGAVSTPGETKVRDAGHDRLGSIFQELPTDIGHWGFPYFEQILNPLQHAPPSYALELQPGNFDAHQLPPNMPESIAGIVVVRLPRSGNPSPTACRGRVR